MTSVRCWDCGRVLMALNPYVPPAKQVDGTYAPESVAETTFHCPRCGGRYVVVMRRVQP